MMTQFFSGLFGKRSNQETNHGLSNKNTAFVKEKKSSQVKNGKYLWEKNMSIFRKYAFDWHGGAS